eukprot:Transcript_21743.p1 GENE.Transcript_21743~~Transcript_21743.p1  ORF type:complete len:441 (-),score=184.09 Transcript_21743:74-1396(-)
MQRLQDKALTAFHNAETAWQQVNVHELAEQARDPKAIGVFLAFSSSAFIGASFVITRKALQRAAARGGKRAGDGGYAYFSEPMWWVGTLTMVVGEFANFSAYAYAPAILVTPLGAISIIVSAIFADYFLQERLHICGLLGCVWCIVGSFVLVSFAPEEQIVSSVEQIWSMATQPLFLGYCAVVVLLVAVLIRRYSPLYGETQVLVYVSICSLIGSLSVVSCKALGIALKLTLKGHNQLYSFKTYVFALCVCICVAGQMNYLNKALDTFNTAMVSSVYYIFFTICTITASMIMYKDWENQTTASITCQVLGFALIVLGVYSLNATQGLKESHPSCVGGLRAMLGDLGLKSELSRRLLKKRVELERVVLLAGRDDASDSGASDDRPTAGAAGGGPAAVLPAGGGEVATPGGRRPPAVPFDLSTPAQCRSLSAQLLQADAGGM